MFRKTMSMLVATEPGAEIALPAGASVTVAPLGRLRDSALVARLAVWMPVGILLGLGAAVYVALLNLL